MNPKVQYAKKLSRKAFPTKKKKINNYLKLLTSGFGKF